MTADPQRSKHIKMLSDSPIKVSVAMITYNHEEFISKAIDSVLMQRTHFDYEIVIGEDCSTDNTRSILVDYQKRYPERFRLLLNERNLGGAHKNTVQTLQACKGKYIALLEGDDYWTSPQKLQKQVDFLDSHPECAICFHNVTEVYKDGSREPYNFHNNQKEFSTVEDLLRGNFIPTPSTMFRRGLFGEFPDWYYSLPMGDWPLHILNALNGKIGYIDEVMAVHLNHPGGVWFLISQNWLDRKKPSIQVYEQLYTHLDVKYRKIIARLLHNLCLEIAKKYESMGEISQARSVAMRPLRNLLVSEELFRILLRLYAPTLHKVLRSLKQGTYVIIGKVSKGS